MMILNTLYCKFCKTLSEEGNICSACGRTEFQIIEIQVQKHNHFIKTEPSQFDNK
jgi:hypothetical protein